MNGLSQIWKESVVKNEELEVQITTIANPIEDMEEMTLLRIEVNRFEAVKDLSSKRSIRAKEQMQ